MDKLLVKASIDYINGHLRYGHKELEVDKVFWQSLSEEEQAEYFEDEGRLVVDDYEINDYGDLGALEVKEIE